MKTKLKREFEFDRADFLEWKVTRAEYEISLERQHDKHYSVLDRADYYQLCRFYRKQFFYPDDALRALDRIRGTAQ